MKRQIRNQILNIMVSVKKGLAYFQVSNKYIVLKKCIQALQSVEQLCQNGFSKTGADYYNQGLSMIIDKLSRQMTIRQDMDKFDCDAFIKSLDIISARLSNDKEVKKEIIFLPYKASMWDSLESIWQAAAADKENCDAYVIPIPYCDRNPDGSAAQWHCEADQFPSYVPITDYREYDIAKHRPDVIYIHNPYDGYNRVTSVDSSYYSSELKKYTNMLVYVPYFVSGPAVSEGICQAPGIVVADHVIVESEEIKKQYEAYYPGGNPPKDKFLALGSPKFDKVLSSKKEDFVLPDSWKKIINGKKIILYNTSLGAMLENSDKVNAKLRYVFSVFKERKDVALWWRPHPLMKATMESMRPEILQEYEQIEQEYINEGWGIYDNTADLHRAITWSDAYYGDMSSVVWLYKVTYKPVMMQNMFLSKMVNDRLRFDYIFTEKNTIWFISQGTFCALYCLNILTDKLECLGELPTQYKMNFEYMVLAKMNNKIIIAPYCVDCDFIEYDILMGHFTVISYIERTWGKYVYNDIPAFTDAIIHRQSIFFIGSGNGLIVEYNGITCQYLYHENWSEGLLEKLRKEDLYFSLHSHIKRDNIVYLAIFKSNYILKLDLNSFNVNIFSLPIRIQNISCWKDFFWIVSCDRNKIIKWVPVDNNCKELVLPIEKYSIFPFMNVIKYGRKWLVIPYIKCYSKFVIEYDKYEYKIDIQVDDQGFPQYTFAIMDQEIQRGFAFNYGNSTLEEFDCNTGKIVRHKISLSNNEKGKYFQSNAYKKNNLIYEGNFINLSDYIDLEKREKATLHNNYIMGKNILLCCINHLKYNLMMPHI